MTQNKRRPPERKAPRGRHCPGAMILCLTQLQQGCRAKKSRCAQNRPGFERPANVRACFSVAKKLYISQRLITNGRRPRTSEIPNEIHAIALPTVRRRYDRAASRAQKRAEALRSKPPSQRNRALQLARERGVVTTAELQAIGVHLCYLTPMCDDGLLVRVFHGRSRAGAGQAGAA